MKLAECRPEFLKWEDDSHFKIASSVNEADGLLLLCPVCLKNNKMSTMGVHSIICWEPNVPQTTSPKPGRWNMSGTGFDDLTLTAGSSSILLTGDGCKAHFFITNGEIVGA